MDEDVLAGDPMEELSFALAEGGARPVTEQLRARVVIAALAGRGSGRPSRPPEEVPGSEAFQRVINQMDGLLSDLGEGDWRRPALRDLTVQELVGHLIGAEAAFLDGLRGLAELPDATEHISSTQATAKEQGGRVPAATLADWRDRTARTVAACAELPADLQANYYGIVLPLDLLLVVRSFENLGPPRGHPPVGWAAAPGTRWCCPCSYGRARGRTVARWASSDRLSWGRSQRPPGPDRDRRRHLGHTSRPPRRDRDRSTRVRHRGRS